MKNKKVILLFQGHVVFQLDQGQASHGSLASCKLLLVFHIDIVVLELLHPRQQMG